jgi:Bacteriophage HK97-gp10, putative tail-component
MAATVQGVDRLKAKLAAIPESVRDAMSDALAGGAADLVAMQKRLAPKDEGELASSIRWDWADGAANIEGLKEGRGEQIAAKGAMNLAINVTTGTGMKIPMNAIWQEFGTVQHPGGQPYFFPAYRALKKKIAARIASASRRAIKALGK